MQTTSQPRASRNSQRWEPMKPAPPVTSVRNDAGMLWILNGKGRRSTTGKARYAPRVGEGQPPQREFLNAANDPRTSLLSTAGGTSEERSSVGNRVGMPAETRGTGFAQQTSPVAEAQPLFATAECDPDAPKPGNFTSHRRVMYLFPGSAMTWHHRAGARRWSQSALVFDGYSPTTPAVPTMAGPPAIDLSPLLIRLLQRARCRACLSFAR